MRSTRDDLERGTPGKTPGKIRGSSGRRYAGGYKRAHELLKKEIAAATARRSGGYGDPG